MTSPLQSADISYNKIVQSQKANAVKCLLFCQIQMCNNKSSLSRITKSKFKTLHKQTKSIYLPLSSCMLMKATDDDCSNWHHSTF